ncbi:MAG: hypothetical protein ACP5H2_08710, partial [Solirubrobacteraceae bacterium]
MTATGVLRFVFFEVLCKADLWSVQARASVRACGEQEACRHPHIPLPRRFPARALLAPACCAGDKPVNGVRASQNAQTARLKADLC